MKISEDDIPTKTDINIRTLGTNCAEKYISYGMTLKYFW